MNMILGRTMLILVVCGWPAALHASPISQDFVGRNLTVVGEFSNGVPVPVEDQEFAPLLQNGLTIIGSISYDTDQPDVNPDPNTGTYRIGTLSVSIPQLELTASRQSDFMQISAFNDTSSLNDQFFALVTGVDSFSNKVGLPNPTSFSALLFGSLSMLADDQLPVDPLNWTFGNASFNFTADDGTNRQVLMTYIPTCSSCGPCESCQGSTCVSECSSCEICQGDTCAPIQCGACEQCDGNHGCEPIPGCDEGACCSSALAFTLQQNNLSPVVSIDRNGHLTLLDPNGASTGTDVAGNSECILATESDCDALGGTFQGTETVCDTNTCGEPCAEPCSADPDCKDELVCSVQVCQDGCCERMLLSEGTPCSDEDVCTFRDACDGEGSCVGAPIPFPDCPLCQALENVVRRRVYLAVLRDFRDTILANSSEGQYYIDLYYLHAEELARLMLLHPQLGIRSTDIVIQYVPALRRRLAGEDVVLTSTDIRTIEQLLSAYEQHASTELRNDLQEIRVALRKGKLTEMVGISVKHAER